MRSRVSSHTVRASPGFTDTETSIRFRSGQIGSLIWMLIGKLSPWVGLTFSAGMSMAIPSSASWTFSQP